MYVLTKQMYLPVTAISLKFTGMNYTEDLADPNSEQFKNLSTRVCSTVSFCHVDFYVNYHSCLKTTIVYFSLGYSLQTPAS